MRFTDLEPELMVAALDYDDVYERAVVRSVQGSSDSQPLHLVEFETGASKGKTKNVTSRQIKCPWDQYEETWWALRHDQLKEEIGAAQAAATKALQTVQLERLRAALSTLDITSGIGQVVERTSKGKMESRMALFLPAEDALKLLPMVAEHGVEQLST